MEEPAVLPASHTAADQAKQLSHFDSEEQFELARRYGKVLAVIEGEMHRADSTASG